MDYLDSVAIIQNSSVQKRLLSELIRDYVILEKRVDSLLKNTLPEVVANEIKYRGNFPPRPYECTILFSDIVGFTQMAENIYWVGFHDTKSNFHCNPYLIVSGNEAVLIDGGSRPDFAVVMMKILQTGISPEQITTLIYQHSDPDLCGSMPDMIDICKNPKLTVLSENNNNMFISYYTEKERQSLLRSIDDYGFEFTFGGRVLQFIKTPYAHSAGSFTTYDKKTKTLFTSDLFGSLSRQWDLYIELEEDCYTCNDYDHCMNHKDYCPIPDMLEFHKRVMPSEKALRYALDVFRKLDIEVIAPQHGSIFEKKKDIAFIIEKLAGLKGVGIDAF